jgi:hypothetical protein
VRLEKRRLVDRPVHNFLSRSSFIIGVACALVWLTDAVHCKIYHVDAGISTPAFAGVEMEELETEASY